VKLWSRWVELLAHREPATSLALCRIVLAVTLLGHLIAMQVTGVAAAAWVDARYGGIATVNPRWLAWFGGATPGNVRAALVVAIVAAALMLLGLFTRVAQVAMWATFRMLSGLNDDCGGASDDLLVNALFVLMFADSGRALSLDARRRGRGGDAPAWPRYVLIGQLVLMYWSTALHKLSTHWVPGGPMDALWYILQEPFWQRRPMLGLARAYPLLRFATLLTWLFEQAAPLLLLAFWFRATRGRKGRVRGFFNRVDVRAVYLVIGLGLHVSILVTMEVGPFFGAVMAIYACCLHPGEWRAIGLRVARWAGRLRGPGAARGSLR
jgi:hypothetical protein